MCQRPGPLHVDQWLCQTDLVEQPADVLGPQRVADRNVHLGLREQVGQVERDRAGLGDDKRQSVNRRPLATGGSPWRRLGAEIGRAHV